MSRVSPGKASPDAGDRGDASPDPFVRAVLRATPEGATVAVVSRGDARLVSLAGRTGWHFPRRADGVWAGYYPSDSDAAIAHVESLRAMGATHLAVPSDALWWLDHYAGFGDHLALQYRLVHRDSQAVIFGLREARDHGGDATSGARQVAPRTPPTGGRPAERDACEVRALFDARYYVAQTQVAFESDEAALAHYLTEGHLDGLRPHPLFDPAWYVESLPKGTAGTEPPLQHFVRTSPYDVQDPNPYFDVEFYYQQRPDLRGRHNALLHYLAPPPGDRRARPNPLFDDDYYRQASPDVCLSGCTPLEDFLRRPVADGRPVSALQRDLLDRLTDSVVRGLTRGTWRAGTVLVISFDDAFPLRVGSLLQALEHEHRLEVIVLALRRTCSVAAAGDRPYVALEDYELAGPVTRPSALRLLSRTLGRLRPVLALTDLERVEQALRDGGVPTCRMGASDDVAEVQARLAEELRSSRSTHAGPHGQPRKRLRTVRFLCSDWSVSGVNTALHAVGAELRARGWEAEILFTRDPAYVVSSAGGEGRMPSLPHRFLDRRRSGVDGLWEALIRELEQGGASIVVQTYDQVANAVTPALTDQVGVVSWLQADDGDYYEQAYRLGRYCNAIVCVSAHIRDRLLELNPALVERVHVIHNTSVSAQDVSASRGAATDRLRLAYAGRLVQYQKRVLDYVGLARALDRTGVSYEILLIGDFGSDPVEDAFIGEASQHLADGRIRLLGRLSRERVFETLLSAPFFVLLSDFEGLPLSVVEAMAAGCVPVTAAMRSGIPELVTSGEHGVVVEGRDYDEWARALVALWHDQPRLAALSRAARRRIADHLTIEQVGDRFDRLLRQVAEEIESGRYRRPPALTWGPGRAPAGDVLPSPNLFNAATFARFPGLS